MIIYAKVIQGNRYEIKQEGEQAYFLIDTTRQIGLAESDSFDELAIFAAKNNLMNPDTVIKSKVLSKKESYEQMNKDKAEAKKWADEHGSSVYSY